MITPCPRNGPGANQALDQELESLKRRVHETRRSKQSHRPVSRIRPGHPPTQRQTRDLNMIDELIPGNYFKDDYLGPIVDKYFKLFLIFSLLIQLFFSFKQEMNNKLNLYSKVFVSNNI